VADSIGAPLHEIETHEGLHEEYVKNEGMSCFVCKSSLYTALQSVAAWARSSGRAQVVLFNGTNKDDKADSTRVGLKAAENFSVASPLETLTKEEVRALARELALPNHAHAASPCLRSRLACGVRATSDNLRRIEQAEATVRHALVPDVHHNLRVRHMRDGSARVEMDTDLLVTRSELLPAVAQTLAGLGFRSVSFGEYRTGSVAVAATSS
jgi:PP-loop superfamily ATP-utilizing enzyme